MRGVFGPFELVERLGAGGNGEVWRARVPGQSADVAVKLLQGQDWSADAIDRFLDEARSASGLDHPNIVQVLDFDVVPIDGGEVPYLAMDVASGGFLGHRSLDWPKLHDAVQQVLDGLAHAHSRGVVHLDVKGENILLGTPRDGRTGWRLVDFGISFALGQQSAVVGVSGTPGHMAPEQWHGAWRDLGPWTDLYGLACTVWELVAGAPLFRGNMLDLAFKHTCGERPRLAPVMNVPSGVEAWLLWLLHTNPRSRPQHAAFAADSWRALASAPTPRALLHTDWRVGEPPRSPFSMGVLGKGAASSRVPPMVGRETERDALWAAARRVLGGAPSESIHLKGPAGVGTSRLARWLMERVVADGRARALVVSAPPGTPLAQAFGPAVARHLVCHGLDCDGARARLIDGELAPLSGEDVDGLLARFGLADGPPLSMVRCVELLSAACPLILVLDGAASDPDSDRLVKLLPEASVLLLVTGAGEVPSAPAVGVAPLSAATMRALLEALLPLTPRTIERLVRGAAGHPGEAVERLLLHIQRGDLVPVSSRYELPDTVPPPSSDDDSRWDERLHAALDRVDGSHVEQALAVAGAIGMSVSDDHWSLAMGSTPTAGLRNALLRAGLVVRQPRRGDWRFTHPRALAAVERRARARGEWQAAHARCAEVLRPVCTAGAWGMHLLEAGRPAEALAPLRAQAEAWLDVARVEEAAAPLDALERALGALGRPPDDLDRGWALTLMARVTYQRDGRGAATPLAERAMVIARRHDDPDLMVEAGRCLAASTSRADPVGARSLIAELVCSQAGRANARLFTRLAAFGVLIDLEQAQGGDGAAAVRDAEALLATGLVPAMQRGDLQRRLAWFAPDVASRREKVLAAMEAFVSARSLLGQASSHYELATMAMSAGDVEGALRHWQEAERLFVVAGSPACHQSRLFVGHALTRLGRLDEADERLASAVGGGARMGNAIVVGLGLIARAVVAVRQKRWDVALAYVTEAETREWPSRRRDDVLPIMLDAAALAAEAGQDALAARLCSSRLTG